MRYWRLARLCADGVCGCCCSMELRLVGRTGVPPRRLLLSRIAFATTRLAILRCISCESACCLAISCATLYQRSRLYPYASSASIRYLRSHIESFIRLLPNALCSFVERDVSSPVVRDWHELTRTVAHDLVSGAVAANRLSCGAAKGLGTCMYHAL